MPITLGSTINSLHAQQELSRSGRALSSTLERLSSGMRINRASDDPAGSMLATNFDVRSRIARQGVRNVNDAISLFNVAAAAISELSTVVTRQLELAVQAASSTYTTSQRAVLDEEADALTAEFNRIVDSTSFNGIKLLDGSLASISIQAGDSNFLLSLQGVETIVGAGTFAGAITLTTGNNPNFVLTQDFDNDGHLDLASADVGSDSVSVFLGNGDGTFQVALTLSAGDSPSSISAADLNSDGNVDIVALNDTDNTLSIFLGNGDGTFQASTTMGTLAYPISAAFGDFDDDGNLDLVSAGLTSNQLNIHLGNGDGTFQSAAVTLSVSGPLSVETVDLDGDGNLDLAVSGDYLAVYLGNGDGTFGPAMTMPTGGYSTGIVSSDLNGDGIPDLATSDGVGDNLSIFLGNGDGTFQTATTLATGLTPASIKSIDINGDGNMDLVSAEISSNELAVFLGNGDGTFQSPTLVTTAAAPNSVAVGDFNEDGVSDLVSADVFATRLEVFLQATTTSAHQAALNLNSVTGATSALSYLEELSSTLSSAQGGMSSSLSRLDVALSNLLSTADIFEEARSKILDVDVAAEVADLVRLQIKHQSATAVLAQANQLSSLVMRLLKF